MLRPRATFAPTALAVLLLSTSSHADTKSHFETYTLDNGLRVILSEDHRAPTVAVDIVYDVSAKDDPANRHGLTHLVDVLLQAPSTRHVGSNVVEPMFKELGVSPYARRLSTRVDRTMITTSAPSNQLELILWLESDRMGFFLDGADERALGQARDELETTQRGNEERTAYGNVGTLVAAALYPADHPYHASPFGVPSDVESVTHAELAAFANTYFVPNNAALVIAGDVDPTKTKEMVQKYFGPIVRGQTEPSHVAPSAPVLASETKIAIEANVVSPRLVVTWPSPAFQADGDQALDAVARILANGSDKGRLVKRLMKDQSIAKSVTTRQRSRRLSSELSIDVLLAPNQSPDAALAIVDEELDKLRKGGLSRDEAETAKLSLLRTTAFDSDGIASRAGAIGSEHAWGAPEKGGPIEYVAAYAALTPEKIQAAVVTYMPRDKRVVAVVTPNPDAPAGGRIAGAK